MNPFRMDNFKIRKVQAARERCRPRRTIQKMHMALVGNTILGGKEAENASGYREKRQGDSDWSLQNQVQSRGRSVWKRDKKCDGQPVNRRAIRC